jgi:predicted RNA-binding protein YlqC (UPF0109 family)
MKKFTIELPLEDIKLYEEYIELMGKEGRYITSIETAIYALARVRLDERLKQLRK